MGIWVVLCLAGLVMSSYAWIVSNPTGSSPDDDFHQASIWCPIPANEYCATIPVPDQEPQILVPQTVAEPGCYRFDSGISAACTDNLSDTQMVATTHYNSGLYPGYYYDFMHLFVENDVDRAILVMRWINVGLAALMYGAIFFLAAPTGRRLVTYTLLGTAVPLVTFLSTSINPSAWGIMGVVCAWLGLHLGLTSASTPRRLALFSLGSIGALMAACARADAGAYLVIVCCAILVYHWPTLVHRLRLLTPLVVVSVLGVAGFLSGDQSAAATQGLGFTAPVQTHPAMLFLANLFQLPGFLTEFWDSSLGWLDTPVPATTAILAAVVTIGLCFWGIVRARMSTRHWLALIGLFMAIVGVPLLILQAGHTYFPGSGVQVRYVAPLIVVLVGACLADRTEPSPPLSFAATVVFVAFVSIANMYALYALIQRYVSGLGYKGFNLSSGLQWWRGGGPSPMWTWVIGSVGFACMATILFAVRNPRFGGLAQSSDDHRDQLTTTVAQMTGQSIDHGRGRR